MLENIKLSVSLGEALDKLSILDIKLSFIKDEKRIYNVRKEYDLIYDQLKIYTEKYSFYYNILKNINIYIWELMDILRDGNVKDEEYLRICKDTIIGNDMRFRVKNKINCISGSLLKEEKGYIITRVFFEILDIDIDFEKIIKPLHYYSLIYDEIYIYCLEKDICNIQNLLENNQITIVNEKTKERLLDDIKIKKFILNNNSCIYETLNIDKNILNKIL